MSHLEDTFANRWGQLYPELPPLREQTCPPWQSWAEQRKALGLSKRRVVYRADFLWPAARVIVELQGATWTTGGHSTGTGIERDATKALTAAAGGWLVIPLTGTMLERQGDVWLPMIAETILARAAAKPQH